MNTYEAKLAARQARYEDRAENTREQSDAVANQARAMASIIPFGQPILVGHHSEAADRRYRERIHKSMHKAVALDKKADYYEAKAQAVGRGGVSSDDPDAVEKLKKRLAVLQETQEVMKKANAAIRRHKGDEATQVTALVAIDHIDERRARELLEPDFAGRLGFPSFELTNNNANIRRIASRIKELESAQAREAQECQGSSYLYREDPEENRAMFVFDGKPEKETRAVLKSNGFRWSPTRGAWVRQLTGNATWAAKRIREVLDAQ